MRALPLFAIGVLLSLSFSYAVAPGPAALVQGASVLGATTLDAPVALGAPAHIGAYSLQGGVPDGTSMTATITIRAGSDPAPVIQYLNAEGFQVNAPHGAIVWLISGTAAMFERAFSTSLAYYSDAPGTTVAAFTQAPQAPSSLPIVAIAPPDGINWLKPAIGPHGAAPSTTQGGVVCPSSSSYLLSPAQVQTAYNISPVLASGDRGQGETIGIVDAYDSVEPPSRISSDLAQFSSCEGLPAANISYDYPVPGGNLNNTYSSGWGLETALDTQWAHATAPDAHIALVLSPNNAYGLYFGVDWLVATRAADVISLSWGEPESGIFNFGPCSFQCNASSDGSLATLGPVLAQAASEGITVFVASGDCGANGGTPAFAPWYPASDPHAMGVGGTILKLSPTGSYGSETAWNGTATYCSNGGGSGGGFSELPRPTWQQGKPGFSAYTNTTRGVPDVALTAAVPLGMIYNGSSVYVEGTSDAAPQWAGMGALIGESLGGGPPGFLALPFYSILSSPAYLNDFHQITKGSNGYKTGPYWNAVTGMGTPNFTALLRSVQNLSYTPLSGPGQLLLTASPMSGTAPYPWDPLPVHFSVRPWAPGNASQVYQYYLGDTGPPYGEANATTNNSSSTTAFYRVPGAHVAWAVGYDNGSSVSMSNPLVININNSGPLATELLIPNATAKIGQPVEFDAAAGNGSAPYRFAYFFGDGTYESSWAIDGPTITHSYSANGTYLVTVVANDSSTPQRGGWASGCVYVGTTSVPCPSLARTPSVSLVPGNATLRSNGSTPLTLHASYNGQPVAGAAVHFHAAFGNFSSSSIVTNATGDAFTTYTAPWVNQTRQYPLWANITAGGYANGTAEVLVIVNPTAGPSLVPSISLSIKDPLSGSSDGIIISSQVAVTGAYVPNATVTLTTNVGKVIEPTDVVNFQGYLVATLLAPTLPAGSVPLAGALFATVLFPGFTSSSTSLAFNVEPGPGGLRIAGTVNNTTMPAMTTTGITIQVQDPNGSAPPPAFGGISVGVYAGSFSYWGNYSNGRVHVEYSAPMASVNVTDVLYYNVTAPQSREILGSAVSLINVTWGHGPLLISFTPDSVVPRFHGNLTFRIRSAVSGLPLCGVLVIVTVDKGNGTVDPNAGFTGAFGRVAIGYVAPNFTGPVLLNITAIGFVYRFTVEVLPLQLALPPPPPNQPSTPGVSPPATLAYLAGSILAASVAAIVYSRRGPPREPPGMSAHAPLHDEERQAKG